MRKTFIETAEFTEWVGENLSDDGLAALQWELLADPEKGNVIPGCGGLRKLRIADPRRGKGRRGGTRVIYLHVAAADIIFLMDAYAKGEQEDLTSAEKTILKALADEYKRAAIRAAQAHKRGQL